MYHRMSRCTSTPQVSVGLLALFVPLLTAPPVAVVVSVLPSLLVGALLCSGGGAGAGTSPEGGGKAALPQTAGSAGTGTALLFLLCGALVGTNGEALLGAAHHARGSPSAAWHAPRLCIEPSAAS